MPFGKILTLFGSGCENIIMAGAKRTKNIGEKIFINFEVGFDIPHVRTYAR